MEASNGDGFLNSVKMLQRREINGYSRPKRCFSMRNPPERFRNIFLQEEYHTKDPSSTVLPFHRRQTEVIDIVSAHGIVFALQQSGVCAAFSRETNQRICFLNLTSNEAIRILFYNKYNDSLITVSHSELDYRVSSICRTTKIEYIQCGQPDAGFTLFESESLKSPSFINFDDVNGKVLIFCSQESIYKVFDLKNYTMLYSFSAKDLKQIKISPGTMLLIYTKVRSHVPLKIISIEDGSVLQSFNHLLHRNRRLEFIQPFNEKLLVKQKNEKLQILDVRTSEIIKVSGTESMTLSAYNIYLYEKQLFMTFRAEGVAVWNLWGQPVTFLKDHIEWHNFSYNQSIHITRDQDLIIFYCKDGFNDRRQSAGSIKIYNILTGKCLAKINAGNTHLLRACMCSSGRRCNLSRPIRPTEITSTVAQALENVTAIYYDEEFNVIYTGNRAGLLHVWSS